jgi:acetamidase/formamidase
VMTSAATFEAARSYALEEMLRLVEWGLDLEPADALALISAVGDLRICHACGGMDLTLRIEMPRYLGLAVGKMTHRGSEGDC